jgi:hypothetical protein
MTDLTAQPLEDRIADAKRRRAEIDWELAGYAYEKVVAAVAAASPTVTGLVFRRTHPGGVERTDFSRVTTAGGTSAAPNDLHDLLFSLRSDVAQVAAAVDAKHPPEHVERWADLDLTVPSLSSDPTAVWSWRPPAPTGTTDPPPRAGR